MAKRFSFIGIYLVLQQNDERMRSIVKIGEERKKLSNLSNFSNNTFNYFTIDKMGGDLD